MSRARRGRHERREPGERQWDVEEAREPGHRNLLIMVTVTPEWAPRMRGSIRMPRLCASGRLWSRAERSAVTAETRWLTHRPVATMREFLSRVSEWLRLSRKSPWALSAIQPGA